MKHLVTGGQYLCVSVDGQSTVEEANRDHNAGQAAALVKINENIDKIIPSSSPCMC